MQNKLRRFIPRARWTRAEGVHLTLKFLGDVEENIVSEISSALDDVVSRHQSFVLNLQGVGAFPRLAFPRVLWVGMQHSEELITLHKDIEGGIAPLGFPTEKRSFRGHLTLARLNGERWPEEWRREFLELSSITDGKTLPVDQVVLFRSDLKPGGAIYTPLHVSLFTGTPS